MNTILKQAVKDCMMMTNTFFWMKSKVHRSFPWFSTVSLTSEHWSTYVPWTEDQAQNACIWSFHLQMGPRRCCRYQSHHPSQTDTRHKTGLTQKRERERGSNTSAMHAVIHHMSTRGQKTDIGCFSKFVKLGLSNIMVRLIYSNEDKKW